MEFELKHLTQSDLAIIFDKCERTVIRWHLFGLPKHGKGPGAYYVWSEVLPWYVAYAASLRIEDPDARLPKLQPPPKPGLNYFKAMGLLEQVQDALRNEAGTAYRPRRKKTAKRAKPKPAPRRGFPHLG